MSLEQYRIADFLEWHDKKLLELNPDFQRRAVWSTAAKIVLIDTILRGFPIPKIYLRTRIDLKSKSAVRDVVDGQQRLRAIIDFAKEKFVLSKRSKNFAGHKYGSLKPEFQERFLSYPIAVDQLINASDSDVLEVFARLNSYNVTLNEAEKRHARFSSDFKWAVHDASQRWDILWERFEIVSKKARLRMLDTSLMAEMFGVLLDGVGSGDQGALTKLYQKYDGDFPQEATIAACLDQDLRYITTELADVITGPIASPPHFLMLFAAVAHVRHGIPPGELKPADLLVQGDALKDVDQARANLNSLADAIESKAIAGPLGNFVVASLSNAHRMASRSIRFPMFLSALRAVPI